MITLFGKKNPNEKDGPMLDPGDISIDKHGQLNLRMGYNVRTSVTKDSNPEVIVLSKADTEQIAKLLKDYK